MPSGTGYECSFAVITVVPEAHRLWVDGLPSHQTTFRDGYRWTVSNLPAAGNGTHLVVEAQQPERSLLPAGSFAAHFLDVWRPRCLIIADIGGGIWGPGPIARDGLALGDVVAADRLDYYELIKIVPPSGNQQTRIPRSMKFQQPSTWLSTLARDLAHESHWHQRLRVGRPSATHPPKLLPGGVVSGDKLLTDTNAHETRRIVDTYDKALAVDMESVGAAHAVFLKVDAGHAVSFAALRGISDWIDQPDNQETRDAWKAAASDAAIAVLRELIEQTPGELVGVTPAEAESIAELRRRLHNDYYVPPIAYESHIDAGGQRITREGVLGHALKRHGVALVGGAGLGKSTMLHHAAMAASGPLEAFPVLVDLKRWRPKYADRLDGIPTAERLSPFMDVLLSASVQRIGVGLFEEILARREVLLMVDGLNEVPFTPVASRILELLDEYMRAHPEVRVLVTDRGGEGFYRDSGWDVLKLRPLDAVQVTHIIEQNFGAGAATTLDDEAGLLENPFFLDRALRGRNLDLASRASALGTFFSEQLRMTDEHIDALAAMAFNVYAERRQRTFPESEVEELLGTDGFHALRAGGALKSHDSLATFSHQLEHDYLAARHMARHPHYWTTSVLDALTFNAASFDVPALVLELLDDESARDIFVRKLYDWNWRGTITAVASAEQEGHQATSAFLHTAILAVAAEKRFDPVRGTRDRADNQLQRFRGYHAQQLRSAATLRELTTFVREVEGGPEWFASWQNLFCGDPLDRPLRDDVIDALTSSDALHGWTAANVIKRYEGTDDASRRMREMVRTASDTTRWRAVHVLGAWPSDANAAVLVDALSYPHRWVVYGAVRSLMEMAARTGDDALRRRVLAALADRVDTIPNEALSQIALTPLYEGAPADYQRAVRPLITSIIKSRHNVGERERWRSRLARFDEFWDRA
ncbi:hypothetical protein OJ997_14600 [Solirubrobacter phytolaccae]|uniref:Nucleoside phosphorylase domain-containing protein n=1 Tax=Solirubrobacter phytolaccae TaxID=1404360 RepID=A0A9X3SFH6_9ACTN|nr:hypothetical protein [Solirubrobacter phytolaccae]MDA0181532.1 hypothetical protein [Solirubrobacter phytolaccae]